MSAQALQSYYTSCKKGLSGYAGFQTRAESAGIALAERREIEAKGVYQPPRNLPREPDAADVAEQFPVALRAVRLSSGRTAIIRSCYGGQDYSGRWGNYFAHALVVDGEIGGWPIDSYRWRGWVGRLPAGEDERPSDALPAASLEEALRQGFAWEELAAFLQERAERPDLLARMIGAVFARAADSRSLVIRETENSRCVLWMACIQKAFPAACHSCLTCSTYQFDPRTCQAINATVGETDFVFNDAERKYQFYVFDFATGRHSEVGAAGAEYAQAVSQWMSLAPARLGGFHEFAALFEFSGIGPELLQVLRLWRISQGENLGLPACESLELIRFAGARARAGTLPSVLAACAALAGSIGGTAKAADWAAVVHFLAGGARSTGTAEDRRLAAEAWVASFHALVLREQREEDRIAALRAEVEATIGDRTAIARAFLAPDRFPRVLEEAGRLPDRILRALAAETARSCRALYSEPEYEAEPFQELVKAVVRAGSNDVEWILDPYRQDLQAIPKIVRLAAIAALESPAPAERHYAIGRSLAGALTDQTVRASLVRAMASKEKFANIVFGEWEASIQRAPDRVAAQAAYERHILPTELCGVELRGRMAGRLLKLLDDRSQRRLACDWVKTGRVRDYERGVAESVLGLAADDIGIAPDDRESEELAEAIDKESERLGIRTESQRVLLRIVVASAMADPPDTRYMKMRLKSADARSYEDVAALVLPSLVQRAKSVEDHRRAFLAFAVEKHAEAFRRQYAAALESLPRDKFEDCDSAALGFWMSPGSEAADDPLLTAMRDKVVDLLADRVAKLPKKARAACLSEVKRHSGSGRMWQRTEWSAFLDRIQSPGFFGRLFGR